MIKSGCFLSMLTDVILHPLLSTKRPPPLQLCTGVEEDILILSKVMQPSWEFVGYALTVVQHQSFKLRASGLLVISKRGRKASLSSTLSILDQR